MGDSKLAKPEKNPSFFLKKNKSLDMQLNTNPCFGFSRLVFIHLATQENPRSKRKKDKQSSKAFSNTSATSAASAAGKSRKIANASNKKIKNRVLDASILPQKTSRVGLQDLRGKWNGTFRASGQSQHIDVDIDLVGQNWYWGPNTLEALVVKGRYNSRDGVTLNRVQLDADGASFRASGRLLCKEKKIHQYTNQIDDFSQFLAFQISLSRNLFRFQPKC